MQEDDLVIVDCNHPETKERTLGFVVTPEGEKATLKVALINLLFNRNVS